MEIKNNKYKKDKVMLPDEKLGIQHVIVMALWYPYSVVTVVYDREFSRDLN